jgi:UDP:flavonoid glycosyltransferase YjiC (YdhE family)
MKILLIAIGTRGDVEPFLALGEMLQERGHTVTCQFPEQFRSLAENSNLLFEGLTPDFLDMLNSRDGKMVMGGKGGLFEKLGAYIRVYKKSLGINKKMLYQQHELVQSLNPDKVLYSVKATYAVVWETIHPGKTINISPIPYLIHVVKNHGHMGFNGDYGAFLNGLTYKFVNYMLTQNINKSTKEIRATLGITAKQVQQVILKKKMVYTLSRVFFKEQDYWPNNVKVLGYYERKVTSNWSPNSELVEFIKNHSKILFVTFGSMTNPEPEEKTRIILKILTDQKIPAIINVAAGGLVIPEEYDQTQFHFVSQIPYEWILPKIHAIMHHGGSGTSHLAVKYSCATMIIPHILDQFIWNNIYTRIGVGPKGIAIDKITERNLKPKMKALFTESCYKEKSEQLTAQMNAEQFIDQIIDFIEDE